METTSNAGAGSGTRKASTSSTSTSSTSAFVSKLRELPAGTSKHHLYGRFPSTGREGSSAAHVTSSSSANFGKDGVSRATPAYVMGDGGIPRRIRKKKAPPPPQWDRWHFNTVEPHSGTGTGAKGLESKGWTNPPGGWASAKAPGMSYLGE
jgi:hypothetical protein